MLQFQKKLCPGERMGRPYFIGPFRLLPGVQLDLNKDKMTFDFFNTLISLKKHLTFLLVSQSTSVELGLQFLGLPYETCTILLIF